MLTIKPNCECCDIDLPADSTAAYICSYECTFCVDCVDNVLHNVCPNCGGGFSSRPIRPAYAHRAGISREHQKPSSERVLSSYSKEEMRAFSQNIARTAPHLR
ncbi:MAG: DUF1272 domain-containing protein [Gammaproteobacteria bacterium]|nr:DUF1272 domain-containing protein [Gammaproteobacteria bacterium]NVK88309.1 DUF1272 domain-containing protein [Gammaproteobacteria bacterium]